MLLVLTGDAVRPHDEVVQHADCRKRSHDGEAGIFGRAFPKLDDWADARIVRQAGIDLRLVGVMQHVHHVRAADTRRIIEPGILEAARLQIFDPRVGPTLHLLLRAEYDRLGRARLLTRRSLADRDPVGAERALVGLVIDLGDARNVERASLHAVTAANAVLVNEVHDTIRILHDRAGRRAGLQAARVSAVHAAVLADQKFEILGFRVYPFGEAHHRETVRRQIERIVVHAVIDPDLLDHVIPFKTRDLAGLAADALRHIDQLGDLRELPRRRRNVGGRAPDKILLAIGRKGRLDGRIGKRRKHARASYATGPAMGSISTRNALYSGVSMLASPTYGVSELGPKPLRVSPMKPQCSGMPTMCTGLPSQVSVRTRLVTTAFAFTEPRFDHTRTQPPDLMPFSLARSSPISTKNSGCSEALIRACFVQKWKCSVSR